MAMTDERAMLMMKNYLDMGMGYGKKPKKKKMAKGKKSYKRRA